MHVTPRSVALLLHLIAKKKKESKNQVSETVLTLFPHAGPPPAPKRQKQKAIKTNHCSPCDAYALFRVFLDGLMHTCRTYHLLHKILHNEALLLRANISHPHPAIIQLIVNNEHVPF